MLNIIYIIFITLGIIFLFFPKSVELKKQGIILDRMIKQDCSIKKVKCIDSCDFLCTEDNYECKNNICQLQGSKTIQCNKDTGGIVVLTHFNFIPYWECLCTHPHFYGGSDCSEKRSDVCKKGTFQYSLDKWSCTCKSTDFLIYIDNKPFCIDPQYKHFFPETI